MSKQLEVPPQRTLTHLERKHANLKERVETLDSQMTLTAEEEFALQQLKKQKLKTKDKLKKVRESFVPQY